MVRGSRYAERMGAAHPGLAAELAQDGHKPFTVEAMQAAVGGCDHTTLDAALRTLRRRVMMRLIFRDLNGLAGLEEVMRTISALADVAVTRALAVHRAGLIEAWGVTDSRAGLADMVVVGMGKLGAHELNVSSDIDLIFVHAEDGAASADRSWREFHSELGKRVIRSIDQVDENGFVFRVDMRLRPFGASGPLVSSLASLEDYFRAQARPWERYAWLKARAMSGHAGTVRALEEIVTPFVYRRYHDYAAIGEMRELHGQIRAEATKRNKLDDIKVGEGGIREVEFAVQLHQLMRGGREAILRTPSTIDALSRIGALGLLPQERVARLHEAYRFLRNLEHRLQYLDDQQTQALPSNDEDRARIANAMGFGDWSAFEQALGRQRAIVTAEFESLFTGIASEASGIRPSVAGTVVAGNGETSGVDAVVSSALDSAVLPADEAAAIRQRTTVWQTSSRTQTLSPKLKGRLERLIPAALHAALAHPNPRQTFFRLFDLFEAIDKRETYLALLTEYPAIIDRLARIFSVSAWAAQFIKRHPIVLDELVRAPQAHAAIDWTAERERLDAACAAAAGDTEQQYELLRHAKQVILLRLNVADIEGRIGVMALSDELSALADMLLDLTVRYAWKALHGDEPFRGFAVIGYGKLGSKELGYASDLDVVFVYDAASTVPPERYGRLAQRINSWLNTMTAGGVLYETDLRLRPDGAAGLLVTSLDAYAAYQETRAWTWEHQALTRARWCAGDAALASPFQAIRDRVLAAPRDRSRLMSEIVAMRDKMRAEKKDRPDALDLKNTAGGIVDIEFIVQFLILAYAHEHAEFLGNLGNFALLARAGALGILDEDQAARMGKAYLAYRERLHIAQNNDERKAWISLNELATERDAVAQVWKALFRGVS
jgi:glutamate-ammonia-ligase adenylyltransferase